MRVNSRPTVVDLADYRHKKAEEIRAEVRRAHRGHRPSDNCGCVKRLHERLRILESR